MQPVRSHAVLLPTVAAAEPKEYDNVPSSTSLSRHPPNVLNANFSSLAIPYL